VPLTTIAREVGCSVVMLDRHYAGVLAEWDGVQRPAAEQVAAAHAEVLENRVPEVCPGRSRNLPDDSSANGKTPPERGFPEEPSGGLEPPTPSLPFLSRGFIGSPDVQEVR
jgi:hypothetical protein